MVKVKFLGLLRMDLKTRDAEFNAVTVEELLAQIASSFPISVNDLRNCIIFVRGKNITQQKLFKTELKDGDEVLFMNAVSGG